MGFTLLCGGPWRRRRSETPAPAPQNGRQSRQAEMRKRETLHKKMPVAPIHRQASSTAVSSPEEEDPALSVVELDVETPVRISVDAQAAREVEEPTEVVKKSVSEPPDGCVELAADPPAPKPPKPAKEPLKEPQAGKEQETSSTVAAGPSTKQRSSSLPACPPFLVPGSRPAGSEDSSKAQPSKQRSATLSAEASNGSKLELLPGRHGFGSGWWHGPDLLDSTLADWQAASPVSLSSSGRSGSQSTISPYSLSTPMSSQTSLSAKEELDSSKQSLTRGRKPSLSQIPMVPTRSLSAQPRLSMRQSSGNMSQLLARHALLESRKQILLQLHEVEQEQEWILDELATMPEEEQAKA